MPIKHSIPERDMVKILAAEYRRTYATDDIMRLGRTETGGDLVAQGWRQAIHAIANELNIREELRIAIEDVSIPAAVYVILVAPIVGNTFLTRSGHKAFIEHHVPLIVGENGAKHKYPFKGVVNADGITHEVSWAATGHVLTIAPHPYDLCNNITDKING